MAGLLPKLLSPRAHRRFDTFVPPGTALAALLMARRDPVAATLILMVGAVEGTAMLTTDYPPRTLLGWMSLRQHVRVANLHGGLIAAMGLLVPGIRPWNRALILGMAALPWVLNAMTRVPEEEVRGRAVRDDSGRVRRPVGAP
ncbi:hypothetical protein ACE7GA_07860 [Roseomonas sp. CCTCC AB2023176]|uniref:hypothetical protein n=1 Tax=Roseomonas sp. CCTCC AB2023176 TaxID=3342640 RepID=UPI0035D7C477